MNIIHWIEREMAGLIGPTYGDGAHLQATLFATVCVSASAAALAVICSPQPWGAFSLIGLALGACAAGFLLYVIIGIAYHHYLG